MLASEKDHHSGTPDAPRSCWTADRNWPYGRVWWNAKGKPTYHIRWRVNGILYERTTRCSKLDAAFREYRRFELDPGGYVPGGAPLVLDPVALDAALKKSFLAWSLNEGTGGTGNSGKYVQTQGYDLDWWGERLRGLDLRAAGRKAQVSTEILETALQEEDGSRVSSYSQRIRTISVLYTWLVKTRRITPAENPVVDRIHAPKSEKAILNGTKRIIADADFHKVVEQLYKDAQELPDEVERILAAAREVRERFGGDRFLVHGNEGLAAEVLRRADLVNWGKNNLYYYFRDGADLLRAAETGEFQYASRYTRPAPAPSKWGDILVFLGGGGFHVTETNRFCRGEGIILPIPPGTEKQGGAGIVVVTHKTKKPHPERVSERCLESARRLLGSGGFNHSDLTDAIKAACAKAEVEPFTPGVLRHKFITYAVEHGASLREVGDSVGHGSIETTQIYLGYAATKKVPSLL